MIRNLQKVLVIGEKLYLVRVISTNKATLKLILTSFIEFKSNKTSYTS